VEDIYYSTIQTNANEEEKSHEQQKNTGNPKCILFGTDANIRKAIAVYLVVYG
jgi:hypothetical protein